MEEVLIRLGINKKEAKVYLLLVSTKGLEASEIAKKLGESRTNTYMILERLINDGLVIENNEAKVKTFSATDPKSLRDKLNKQQIALREQQIALNSALPELTSLYRLSQQKPGVVYFEGFEGYKLLLEDMAKVKDEVYLIASDSGPANTETWGILLKGLAKRKARNIKTKAIFHKDARDWPNVNQIIARGFELRFWGKEPREGEIVIYGNKIAFTVYKPSLIVTVITDDVLSNTFKVLFEEMWLQANRAKNQ